jgi:hypothetical protein
VGCIVVVGFLLFVVSSANEYDRLLKSGLPGRGILLQVSPTATRVAGTRPSVRRDVLIDVEVAGRAPFELRTSLYIPQALDRDVLPGATLDIRVDPKNPKKIAIVGPGAFIAALPTTTNAKGKS